MADALDMSLDELISKSRSSHQRPSGRGAASRGGAGAGGGGPAPTAPRRRFNTRAAAAPYLRRGAAFAFKTHSRPMAYAAAGYRAVQVHPRPPMVSALDEPTKLYVSNLHHGVSNDDIKELFSDVGDVKRYSINYDRSGRSMGTSEVLFSRRSDALAAFKRYNNVQLDGKPMQIEIIGRSIQVLPPVPPPTTTFSFHPPALNFNFPFKSGPGRGGAGGWPQSRGGFRGRARGRGGHAGRGRGRGRGRGEGRGEKVSAEDLDADLDKYHAAAMETS